MCLLHKFGKKIEKKDYNLFFELVGFYSFFFWFRVLEMML